MKKASNMVNMYDDDMRYLKSQRKRSETSAIVEEIIRQLTRHVQNNTYNVFYNTQRPMICTADVNTTRTRPAIQPSTKKQNHHKSVSKVCRKCPYAHACTKCPNTAVVKRKSHKPVSDHQLRQMERFIDVLLYEIDSEYSDSEDEGDSGKMSKICERSLVKSNNDTMAVPSKKPTHAHNRQSAHGHVRHPHPAPNRKSAHYWAYEGMSSF